MARRKVIVKRLAGIHDLGEMTVLCTDKTGTLTSAEITLAKSLDPAGATAARPARLGAVAAALGGDRGPLDAALTDASPQAATGWRLVGQRPFDYAERVGSVLAEGPEGRLLIVKGAPEAVLARCKARRDGEGIGALGEPERAGILARVHGLAEEGLRSIAVASGTGSETALVFEDSAPSPTRRNPARPRRSRRSPPRACGSRSCRATIPSWCAASPGSSGSPPTGCCRGRRWRA